MKNGGIFLAGALFLFAADLHGAFDPSAPPVLHVPVSARASALGNSLYCSEFDGVRYNPAYLSLVENAGIWGTYAFMQQGSNFGSVYGQFRAGNAGWGLGIADISSGFDRYTDVSSPRAGRISVSQTLFSAAGGIKTSEPGLLFGAAARMLTDTIDGSASSGYSADIGAGYVFSGRFRMGLVLNSFLSFSDNNDDVVPQRTTFSAAYYPKLTMSGQTGGMDNGVFAAAVKDDRSNIDLSLGLESVFNGVFAVRAGFDRDHPVFGVGFRRGAFDLDAAAAFKEAGYLYFMTLGARFARPAVDPEKSVLKPAPRAERLAKKGWEMLRSNDLQSAARYFSAALDIDPENGAALEGRKVLDRELARAKKKDEQKELLSEADAALRAGQYVKAEQAYRRALESDPGSREAKEGIRSTVETVGIALGEALKTGTTRYFSLDRVPAEEALALSKSGTFKNLVASLDMLSGGNGLGAYGEWMKVQPRECRIVEKYNEAFSVYPVMASEANIGKARKLASAGRYRDAIAELDKNQSIEGLDDSVVRKTTALMASYAHTGQSVGADNLKEAKELISKGRYAKAAACLDRVTRSGYGVEEAERLRKSMAAKQKQKPARARPRATKPKPKPAPAPVQKSTQTQIPAQAPAPAPMPAPAPAAEPKPLAPVPAEPVAPRRTAPREPDLNPVIREKLLRQYIAQANQSFKRQDYRGCRECLLKILFLEPDNQDAKDFLKKVDELIKSSAKNKK